MEKKLYPTTRIDCCKCFDCICLLCIKSATLPSLMFTGTGRFSASFGVRVKRLEAARKQLSGGEGGWWGGEQVGTVDTSLGTLE